ncbi:hypothetical protein N480_09250 [Pseudoalteromonas luteoviolacea S2607]|uniref:hypothetical protein n=1 Tax=Pseudoalteromonas luteoviolacea TaxID=43657 RepID=UPI0007B0BA9E|nr:hypothetical protein [Pseudoalteromonas luteoviolacea]KZN28943.1 hypothetical protein N480_09250 [Pseudoalteromonas luteoviolacea S2607]
MKNWFKHFFSKHDEHCAEHQTDVFNFTTALLGQSKTAMLQALIHDAMGNPFITVRYHLGRRRTDPLTTEFNSVALVNIDKLLISNRWEVRAENQWHEGVYTLVFSKEKLLDVLHTRSIFYTNQEQSEVQSYLSLNSLTSLNKPIYHHIIPLMLKSYARQFSKKQSSEQTFLEVKLLKILMDSYLDTMANTQSKQWDEQARELTKARFIERIAANHVGRYTDKQVVQAYETLTSF